MEIELKDFKCFDKFSFSLPKVGLVLIEGKSGSGKTTLINSLMFALFNRNGSKIHNVKPTVTVKGESFEISRSKHPNLLQVKTDSSRLIDLSAQAWINQNVIISAVEQSGLDSFLAASNQDRRAFLEGIIGLCDDQVVSLEEKISKTKKEAEKKVVEAKAVVSVWEDRLRKQPTGTRAQTIPDLDQISEQKFEILKQIELFDLLSKRREKQDQFKIFQAEERELASRLENSSSRLKDFKNAQVWQRRRELIEKRNGRDLTILADELDRLKFAKRKFEETNAKKKRYSSVIETLSNLENYFVASCPWKDCSREIKVEGEILSVVDQTKDKPKKRKRTSSENELLNEALLFQNQKDINEISQIDFSKLSKLSFEVTDLERIEFDLSKLVTVEQFEGDYHELEKLVKRDAIDAERQSQVGSFLKLSIKEEETEVPLQTRQELRSSLDSILENESKARICLEENLKFQEFEKIKNYSTEATSELKMFLEERRQAEILSTVWLESKTTCLDQIVELLEHKVNQIVSKLFADPVCLKISNWKRPNTKNTEKPGFEILLSICDRTFSLSELSGGEKSRLSIAVSCALCEIQGCGFLILDESLSGLDFENLICTTEFLKSWSSEQKCCVVIISHYTINGLFDKVITVQ